MDILLIDNYDSFTYNLAQYIGEVDDEPRVRRNDDLSLEAIREDPPDAIVISPGPGTPSDAGISTDVIEELGEDVPILGVCLGHQCIAEVYGAELKRAERLLHGKTSRIFHADFSLYRNLENPLEATRYHSLLVKRSTVPDSLNVDAVSENDEIMGLHHVEYPILGVQFHPESILTQHGRTLIRNFLDYARDPEPIGEVELPDIPQTEGEDDAVRNK